MKPVASTDDALDGTVQHPLWWQAWRVLRVRLRFVAVLAALALIIGQWDVWSTHVQHWLDRILGSSLAAGARDGVSPDTEYFCPMCPGVLSGWPDTCPICNMPLVRRKKGETAILPSGVLARMQFSPQRIQLAGLQSLPVVYQPLVYRRAAVGRVVAGEGSPAIRIQTLVTARDAALYAACETVTAVPDAVPGALPCSGRIVEGAAGAEAGEFRRLEIELTDAAGAQFARDTFVRLEFLVPVASVEPFRTQPRGVPDWTDDEPRQAFLCPDHLDIVHVAPGKCAHDARPLAPWPLAENQRIRWRCESHPEVLGTHAEAKCERCVDCPLAASVVTFAPRGEVLAIPASALIDTGRETMVYIEAAPGMFDGVKVRVGDRADDMYPVIEGVSAGQRVVARGAFLVDAEARLNPALASTYFGAATAHGANPGTLATPLVETSRANRTPEPAHPPVDVREVRRLLAKFDMPAKDRQLAERQGACPVTGMPLGSMGKPPKMTIDGQPVFICCEGCSGELEKALRKRQTPTSAGGRAEVPAPTRKSPSGAQGP